MKSESDSTGVSASGSDGAMATPVDELRKRLKDASDNFSPSAPSLRIYSINTHGSQRCVCVCVCVRACVCVVCVRQRQRQRDRELIYVHYTHTCMDMLTSSIAQGICIVIALCSMTSSCFHGETFVCGFDNSSIHTWRNRPTTTSSKRIQINKSYSYLSLDDHNNDNHSGISMDRR